MTESAPETLERLTLEVTYLRWLVWKLSVRDLAKQDAKYDKWLTRTYVENRSDLNLHSHQFGR